MGKPGKLEKWRIGLVYALVRFVSGLEFTAVIALKGLV